MNQLRAIEIAHEKTMAKFIANVNKKIASIEQKQDRVNEKINCDFEDIVGMIRDYNCNTRNTISNSMFSNTSMSNASNCSCIQPLIVEYINADDSIITKDQSGQCTPMRERQHEHKCSHEHIIDIDDQSYNFYTQSIWQRMRRKIILFFSSICKLYRFLRMKLRVIL